MLLPAPGVVHGVLGDGRRPRAASGSPRRRGQLRLTEATCFNRFYTSRIGVLHYLWALGNAPATQVTVFLALSPFTAALLGAVLLAEAVTPPAAAGLGCAAAGLWLAHRGEPG